MKIEQRLWTPSEGWSLTVPEAMQEPAHLVLLFGATAALRANDHIEHLKGLYPAAHLVGCSTAGEICGTRVHDDSLVATAIHFRSTTVQGATVRLRDVHSSAHAGEQLAQALDPDGLAHVLVFSDGLKVNGSALVNGLANHLPKDVTITGGLSADGPRFAQTLVAWDGLAEPNTIAVVGLYGQGLRVGYGSLGGWDSFGPERLVTRAEGNVLYELDCRSALDLYKRYLGAHASGLPATGLLYPLSLRGPGDATGVVRTILSTDEQSRSLTFAGDIPVGSYARLMKANVDRLIDGAVGAAKIGCQALGGAPVELALLISCVGRKMVLKQRVEEEVEGVRDVLGADAVLAGFYSYGEIAPVRPGAKCGLHNQTMTLTVFSEG